MTPKPSPLQIVDFALTELNFKTIPPETEKIDLAAWFNNYILDIDFGILNHDYLKVFIKASINKDAVLPGYAIIAEATCVFRFESENLDNNVRKQLEGFSTIYIALNSLRGLISNFTANAPFGRYVLPSVDLNDLIEQKKTKAGIKEVKRPPSKPKSKTPSNSTGRSKNTNERVVS